jgi:hypothetical protein
MPPQHAQHQRLMSAECSASKFNFWHTSKVVIKPLFVAQCTRCCECQFACGSTIALSTGIQPTDDANGIERRTKTHKDTGHNFLVTVGDGKTPT